MDHTLPDCNESTTVRLEWTVRGLKQLFDTSKGETKSKATKSGKFGDGKWQILFYANSGTEGGIYISLYLLCEPTTVENENAADGKWVREGLFKFSFELRNIQGTQVFGEKEACDHSFTYRTANWGWAQFAKRDAVYYKATTVRQQDAFVIICTITSTPASPPFFTIPKQPVPKDLIDCVGDLLDDKSYSDVQFILPAGSHSRRYRTLYAAKRLLSRAEYFRSMFSSGFSESSTGIMTLDVKSVYEPPSSPSKASYSDSIRSADSDAEDESDTATQDEMELEPLEDNSVPLSADVNPERDSLVIVGPGVSPEASNEQLEHENSVGYASNRSSENLTAEIKAATKDVRRDTMTQVIVRDVAYATYRAVLYYLYTDTIAFAPLSSSFLVTETASVSNPTTGDEGQSSSRITSKTPITSEIPGAGPSSRVEWITQWELNNPGKITPCSPKSVYRLADKLGLLDLKARAFQHIVKSLTVQNVPYELFSSFSACFEDVRKVQVTYFLENWNSIRNSDAMRTVWQQIRMGRHPGFEEVWPLIASHLEFRPNRIEDAVSQSKDSLESGA